MTEGGLKALEAQLAEAREAYAATNAIEDVNERRRQAAGPARDMRYLVERLRTAQLVPVSESRDVVGFGSKVRFSRDGGKDQTYRIVGEDEADPKAGSVSYVSPLAKALMGKAVGEIVSLGEQELEIIAIG